MLKAAQQFMLLYVIILLMLIILFAVTVINAPAITNIACGSVGTCS